MKVLHQILHFSCTFYCAILSGCLRSHNIIVFINCQFYERPQIYEHSLLTISPLKMISLVMYAQGRERGSLEKLYTF